MKSRMLPAPSRSVRSARLIWLRTMLTDSPVVTAMKTWVDQVYEEGRNTSLSNKELEAQYEKALAAGAEGEEKRA